ncbi:MAG: hypothetical protein KAJ22_01575 [Candidatus Izimaplasma sp.]|nr:hypothetical protein [Candidatus Izimaplasma bacterium]
MDNLIYKDFASWKLENHEVINTFQENESIIYDRLEPVYSVLNYIYDLLVEEKEIDDDLDTIFQAGFSYLHSQFEIIKIYFETLFQSHCDDFVHYSEMIVYLLYIYDIRTDMENNEINSDIDELNELETCIENMIMERRDDFDYIKDQMNEALKVVFGKMDYDYVSIVDIFVEIAENLGIFIYEDNELVIGQEI